MNQNIILTHSTILLIALSMFSCESHEQKVDEAFEKVKAEKSIITDTVFVEMDANVEPKKIKEIVKNEIQDEWLKFKSETEKKIISNEMIIKQIKNTPNLSVKAIRRLVRLEKDNYEIRIQMEDYQKNQKEVWGNFKLKTSESAFKINEELIDLTLR